MIRFFLLALGSLGLVTTLFVVCGARTLAEKSVDQSDVPSIEFFQNRYSLRDVYQKLVDNRGDGFEALYGVRNFRTVLNGVVYRGGANNYYNKLGKRGNSNPLTDLGLRNLCEEGFSTTVYLYSKNYESAPKSTSCSASYGARNSLEYKQESPLTQENDALEILGLIYERLVSQIDRQPIYLHCWNGWHASGFISALTLRQFCGWSGDQAVAYWDQNTDGHNEESKYKRIRAKIRTFQPDSEMSIDERLREKICPRPSRPTAKQTTEVRL
jgi:hypothetical protein